MALLQPLIVTVVIVLVLKHLTSAVLLTALSEFLFLQSFFLRSDKFRSIDAKSLCLLILVKGACIFNSLIFVVFGHLGLVEEAHAFGALLQVSVFVSILNCIIMASHLLCLLLLLLKAKLIQFLVNIALK